MQTMLLRPWHYSISAIFFCITSCQSQSSSEALTESQIEIQNILETYYTTMSNRDWSKYKTFFCDDAALTTVWQKESSADPDIMTTSITDFIAQTKDGPDSQPIFEEKMLEADIKTKKNLAQAWVKYEAKFGSTDHLMEWKGWDLFSFIRLNGEWKIASIVFESE